MFMTDKRFETIVSIFFIFSETCEEISSIFGVTKYLKTEKLKYFARVDKDQLEGTTKNCGRECIETAGCSAYTLTRASNLN